MKSEEFSSSTINRRRELSFARSCPRAWRAFKGFFSANRRFVAATVAALQTQVAGLRELSREQKLEYLAIGVFLGIAGCASFSAWRATSWISSAWSVFGVSDDLKFLTHLIVSAVSGGVIALWLFELGVYVFKKLRVNTHRNS
jgi:hypothetical protein